MFSPHIACLACGRTGVRITRISEICALCWSDPTTRAKYRAFACRDIPVAPDVCPHPPGTAEKIQWMADRWEDGFRPDSPKDATFDGQIPGCLQPPSERPEVFALPKLRTRGVEKDGKHYRARPWWLGKKNKLGAFEKWEHAEAVVRRFWIEKLGLFWELGGYMGNYFVNAPDGGKEPLAEFDRGHPDVPVTSLKPSVAKKYDQALKSNKTKLDRRSKAEPLTDGGIFRKNDKEEIPRLKIWRVAG